jgi:hypothetical protein
MTRIRKELPNDSDFHLSAIQDWFDSYLL